MSSNPLAYHLADAIFTLIRSSSSQIYRRLNLAFFIFNCSYAMLKYADKEALEWLEKIEEKLKLLRESYEPVMDASLEVFEKKIAFEIVLDEVIRDLLTLINDYELVNPKILQEVYATRWGDGGMDRQIH
jgi:hypothetical protein